jgi:outer membrane protein insertion porin family
MTATQTLSASLVVLLAATPALAEEPEPEASPEQPPGEVHHEEPAHVVVEPPPPVPPPPPRDVVELPLKTPTVELMPKRPTGTFQIGAGFSSDEHFIAVARLSQPRLFGTDKGLSMSALISRRRIESLVRYEDPTIFDTHLRLTGDLFSNQRIYPGFTREAAGGSLSLSRTVAPGLDVFAGYQLQHVKSEANDVTLAMRGGAPPQDPAWRGLVGSVRAGLRYASVAGGDAYYPREGITAGLMVEVADDRLGSDLDFIRSSASLAVHQPLGPFTMHLGGRASSIVGDVPISERLHFDGMRDIRGYAPGAIGPKDANGQPLGGNFAWNARAELEAPLVPAADLNLTGFLDLGGIHDKLGGENAASYGVGLVWRSPLGPLRFDWAFPMGGDGKPRFVFGIGGMF